MCEQLEAGAGVEASVLARLRHVRDLAAGLDPYLDQCTTPESPALAELARAAGLKAGPVKGIATLPNHGFWHPASGPVTAIGQDDRPLILVPFYRAWAAASDTASVATLIGAFEAEGTQAVGLFLPSLKDAAAADWLRSILPWLAPAAIVNATAFSGRGEDGSPLDAAGVPVVEPCQAAGVMALLAVQGGQALPRQVAA